MTLQFKEKINRYLPHTLLCHLAQITCMKMYLLFQIICVYTCHMFIIYPVLIMGKKIEIEHIKWQIYAQGRRAIALLPSAPISIFLSLNSSMETFFSTKTMIVFIHLFHSPKSILAQNISTACYCLELLINPFLSTSFFKFPFHFQLIISPVMGCVSVCVNALS